MNGCEEFESLFRCFREFINEFILPSDSLKELFLVDRDEAEKIIQKLTSNKYWPVAFDLYFSNSLLLAIFGPKAMQHALQGSYPKYFQRMLEKGLRRFDYKNNYFLMAILLGYYIDDSNSWPHYLTANKTPINFDFINDDLLNIKKLVDSSL